jgi:hypothetical protein
MTRVALALLLVASACTESERPGCHYVACGRGLVGVPQEENVCGVRVDGRWISLHDTGQEALNFIRKNDLRTCESRGAE